MRMGIVFNVTKNHLKLFYSSLPSGIFSFTVRIFFMMQIINLSERRGFMEHREVSCLLMSSISLVLLAMFNYFSISLIQF